MKMVLVISSATEKIPSKMNLKLILIFGSLKQWSFLKYPSMKLDW
jgi:hypothetical protein